MMHDVVNPLDAFRPLMSKRAREGLTRLVALIGVPGHPERPSGDDKINRSTL